MSDKGHPKGLFPLFFTEMWERLAFYLMVGILVLYAMDTERGGLGLPQAKAMAIYGTYMAFVYFTPFLGGMIADRFLGFRRSVFMGGVLMAAGLFLLGIRSLSTLYAGLTFLCLGNGLFKPNISAMVGNLYQPGDPKRDAGFNIFYMGINIGAALSALLSAPLRNYISFNAAFVSAGVGLLVGVTVLVFNWKKLEPADRRSKRHPEDITFAQICLRILLPWAIFFAAGYLIGKSQPPIRDSIGASTFGFLLGMLPIVGYFISLWVRATPVEKPGLGALFPVFIAGGTFFMILHLSGGLMTLYAERNTDRQIPEKVVPVLSFFGYSQSAMPSYFGNAPAQVPRPDERTLIRTGAQTAAMFGSRRVSESAVQDVSRGGQVQAVTPNDLTDRRGWNFLACDVFADANVQVEEEKDAHGSPVISVQVRPETAQKTGQAVFMTSVDGADAPALLVSSAAYDAVYAKAGDKRLAPGKFLGLVNAELITSLFNPFFVVVLTPLVVWIFGRRAARGREVTTARKIFIGMVLTTIALLVMVWSARVGHDGAVKVSVAWLAAYYLVITFGELCLSPMGLSLVTKLSPKRYVGLMMGGWFLATAVGNKMAGFISGLAPTAMMFLVLAGAPLLVGLFIFALLPKLDAAIKRYQA